MAAAMAAGGGGGMMMPGGEHDPAMDDAEDADAEANAQALMAAQGMRG
jgi:hypothetical protein